MKRDVKRKAVSYAGGGCLFCGPVHKCLATLDFHHINPQDKVKNISEFTAWNEDLIKELNKCVCLCKNCHALVTMGLIDHEVFILLED